jgi:hypothetical protein
VLTLHLTHAGMYVVNKTNRMRVVVDVMLYKIKYGVASFLVIYLPLIM